MIITDYPVRGNLKISLLNDVNWGLFSIERPSFYDKFIVMTDYFSETKSVEKFQHQKAGNIPANYETLREIFVFANTWKYMHILVQSNVANIF